ncbi:raffinose/stachyose/melibiose transport system permease protein [Streptohalobacillus salinus]|uniref:Raffinose/stachyose/melibiose transport system permease protein n=1 Tax=Streptohalobacillus salinus TaxID=621096 RepID=A0A2V3WA83_9BACI|nr:sugar ABC transporter permease [Streptohalobacillus salinus]PXW90980.1 raffinose/stachyose/melibiose transport system permease protein [Streptohalobacillus salinus]
MKNKDLSFWLFLTPVLLALAIVVFIPLIIGTYYSFTDWNGLTVTKFVGFEHYLNILKDETFIDALKFTTLFSIVAVILLNIIGLGLAILVTQKLKSSNFLRTIFFMPNLIGGLILGFIWQFVFINVFGEIGQSLGIPSLQGWLSTTNTGFWGLVILTIWQMSGYIMIIYIAYLQNIPNELNEAADIDGASSLQRFRHITFPLVAPAFTVSMFLTLSNAFKIYDQNLSLTEGGPFGSTQMVAMDIVRTAYTRNQLAYGQAKAVIFFIIIAVIALSQVYYNKKREVDL